MVAYRSVAVEPFDDSTVTTLAEQSASKNEKLEITGYLYFDSGQFFQYIEGTEESVKALYHSIASDTRHKITHKIEFSGQAEQIFPNWRMWNVKAGWPNQDLQHLETKLKSLLDMACAQRLTEIEFAKSLQAVNSQINLI